MAGGITEVEAQRQQVQEAEERCQRFLADAAHQLRTPLARIQLVAETLSHGVDAAEREQLLTDVVREAARGGRLVTKLLQMARIDRGQALNAEPSDLLALCSDEADRAWTLAPELDVVLRGSHLPANQLMFDPIAVREILANLLDNACRHAATRIDMKVSAQDWVEVRVSDDGSGLAEGTEARVFERFASLDGHGGSGIGLALSRDLARAGGGDLTYEDKAFVLRLPLEVPPPEPSEDDSDKT